MQAFSFFQGGAKRHSGEHRRRLRRLPPGLRSRAVGFTVSIVAVRRATRARIIKPYLSGLQTETPGMFTGPLNQPVRAEASNYYLSSIFGEKRLTVWMNLAALVLLTLLIGGAL